MKLIIYGGKYLGSSCLRTKSCIKDPFSPHICYVYTLKQWSCSWRNCMKEFMEATPRVNPCPTGHSHKATGG